MGQCSSVIAMSSCWMGRFLCLLLQFISEWLLPCASVGAPVCHCFSLVWNALLSLPSVCLLVKGISCGQHTVALGNLLSYLFLRSLDLHIYIYIYPLSLYLVSFWNKYFSFYFDSMLILCILMAQCDISVHVYSMYQADPAFLCPSLPTF